MLPFHQKHKDLLFSTHEWKKRIMFMSGAVAVGLVATIFAEICAQSESSFHRMIDFSEYAPLVVTPLGFMIVAYIAARYFPGTKGSGIPHVITAQKLEDAGLRSRLVSLRVIFGKILLTATSLLCGASIGREGPTVQVGAAIMLIFGRIFGEGKERGLIVAGGAAGIAAAFNTPLAGVVFAIEELSRVFEKRTTALVLAAIVVSGMSAIAVTGNYSFFGTSSSSLGGQNWFVIVVCGVVGGFFGGLFSRYLIAAINHDLPFNIGKFMKKYPIIFAGICGLLLAIIGFYTTEGVFGTGYDSAKLLVEGHQENVPFYYGIVKMVATAISSGSGIVGGFFSPSLAAGAGIGANIAYFFPDVPLSAVVILGMVGYFSGVVQAPITAFVIVFEMTDNHDMVVPIMAVSLIANATSQMVCETSIYQALAGTVLRQVHAHKLHTSRQERLSMVESQQIKEDIYPS